MPHWWQLTEQQRARRRAGMVRMVRAGRPASAAAARYGVTVRTVYLACRAEGLSFGREGEASAYAASRRRRDAIVRAGRKGLTAVELAARFGVSRRLAAGICRKAGVVLPRSPHPLFARALAQRAALRPRAVELITQFRSPPARMAAGLLLTTPMPHQAIADRCGITTKRVHQVWVTIRSAAASNPGRAARS